MSTGTLFTSLPLIVVSLFIFYVFPWFTFGILIFYIIELVVFLTFPNYRLIYTVSLLSHLNFCLVILSERDFCLLFVFIY